MLIGYARVSTADQRLDLQVDRRSTALRSRGRWASPARRFSIAGTPEGIAEEALQAAVAHIGVATGYVGVCRAERDSKRFVLLACQIYDLGVSDTYSCEPQLCR